MQGANITYTIKQCPSQQAYCLNTCSACGAGFMRGHCNGGGGHTPLSCGLCPVIFLYCHVVVVVVTRNYEEENT